VSNFLNDSTTKIIDSTTNIIDDKMGLPSDIWNSKKTQLGYSNVSYQHIHQPALCYPTLANGIQVNTGSEGWQLGNFTEIVPANTINSSFDIHFLNFESASTREANPSVIISNVPVQVPVIYANSRISARLASNSGNRSVTLSVYYHTYING
jgi:hypothetical protein